MIDLVAPLRPASHVEGRLAWCVLCLTRGDSITQKLINTAIIVPFINIAQNMEDLYDDSGYGWDDEDKRNELGDRACRFLVAYDEDDEEKNPIAFINFRFTTQGEYCNCRGGDPCLFVYDIHVAKEKQRKGLGKHLMMLVCLIR